MNSGIKKWFTTALAMLLVVAGRVSSLAQEADSVGDTHYEFTSLEEALKRPAAVYRLNLQRQRLAEVPAEIFSFEHLEELNLSHNRIKELPGQIGELKNLTILNLSHNKLVELPLEIGDLQ
ncbi:MAG TPA: leucine-rich repeat domain-containing protein, partial [Bacteroidales bacterium]|nr:leucine-rich repeat domain-containing protein [Bacteroidales bacterium]